MKPCLAASLLALACTAQAQSFDLPALTADTKKTVLPVVPKVVGAMQAAVADKGVVGAIPVCKDRAPQLIQELRQATGWSIRRVSLKTRNGERGTPDVWEARTLADFSIRAAAGEKPETLEKSEIVREDGKAVLRYMKALPTGEVCLGCHGAKENLDPGLLAKLAETYPHDRATGYRLGEVRGALTVKRPL